MRTSQRFYVGEEQWQHRSVKVRLLSDLTDAFSDENINQGSNSLSGAGYAPDKSGRAKGEPFKHCALDSRSGHNQRLLQPTVELIKLVPSGALGRDLRAVVANNQIMAYGFGIHVPWQTLLITIPVVKILSTLPISWKGLGARENGYVFFLTPLIVSHEQAIAFGAMWL